MKAILRNGWSRWKGMAAQIADFQARWLLTVLYFTLLLPFGALLRRLADPLQLRPRPAATGWVKRSAPDATLAGAKQQF
jgi:hypothetical protein